MVDGLRAPPHAPCPPFRRNDLPVLISSGFGLLEGDGQGRYTPDGLRKRPHGVPRLSVSIRPKTAPKPVHKRTSCRTSSPWITTSSSSALLLRPRSGPIRRRAGPGGTPGCVSWRRGRRVLSRSGRRRHQAWRALCERCEVTAECLEVGDGVAVDAGHWAGTTKVTERAASYARPLRRRGDWSRSGHRLVTIRRHGRPEIVTT